MDTDHPSVISWLKEAYAARHGEHSVVPLQCTLRLKSGALYGLPSPPKDAWEHIRRMGTDNDGNPLYWSV